MQARIWQFNIMMIATLMLFSTMGVAIYHHICGCPVPMVQSAKISDDGHSCCGTQATFPVAKGCNDKDHATCDSKHHKGCKNEVKYLKAPIISTMPVEELAVAEVSFEMPDYLMPDAGIFDESLYPEPLIHSYVLPPRAGGSLVILLNSIKIPFPEDLA